MNSASTLKATVDNTRFVSLTDSKKLYSSKDPLPLLKIASPLCEAVIALQGAQLLAFKATNGAPLLWLSPKASFSSGQAIRGGIPVCAPWFGVNQSDPNKPKHGIVRTQQWTLSNITEQTTDEVELSFEFSSSTTDLPLYAFPFKLVLRIRLSTQIKLSFEVQNLSETTIPFSWALHSYFSVDQLDNARVEGLKNHYYLDAVNDFSSRLQVSEVVFDGEVDRVYENVAETQTISGTPSISISGERCPTVIVWNPGEKLASHMTDIGIENYSQFICVERGAAFGDSWTLAPSDTKSATLIIS